MPRLTFQHPSFVVLMMLGVVLAYLIPYRYYPIPNFVPEAIALLFAFAALVIRSVGDGFPRYFTLGWSVIAPLALAIWLVVAMPFTKTPYPDTVVFTLVSLLAAAAAASAGASTASQQNSRNVVNIFSGFLIAASFLTFLLQIVQYFTPEFGTYWLLPLPAASQPFGNFGQRNHAACLHALALLSLVYRVGQHGQAYRLVWLALGLVALCGIVLSGSRSGSVTGAFAFILFALMRRPHQPRGSYFRIASRTALAVGLYVALYLLIESALEIFPPTQAFDSASTRWMTYGNIPRQVLNELAMNIFLAHPLTGSGWGTFSAETLERVDGILLPQFANNSHNLLTQLAAEAGLIGVLVVIVPIAVVMIRSLKAPLTLERMYLLAFFGVFLAYSMTEFPLWHTFFLLPFAFALGLLDTAPRRIPISMTLRVAVTVIWLGAAMATLNAAERFIHITQMVKAVFHPGGQTPELRQYIAAHLNSPGFSPQTELLAFGLVAVDKENLPGKLALGARVIRQHIDSRLLSKYAALLALNGQQEQAVNHLLIACRFFPAGCAYIAQELAGAARLDPDVFDPVLKAFKEQAPKDLLVITPPR